MDECHITLDPTHILCRVTALCCSLVLKKLTLRLDAADLDLLVFGVPTLGSHHILALKRPPEPMAA